MKLQSRTLILLLTALAMAGGVYLYERQTSHSASLGQKEELTPLFDFKEDQVQRLTVKTPAQTLIFERTAPAMPSTWTMKSPQSGPANEGVIAFLLNLLATSQSDRTLTIPTAQIVEFGLQQPKATIEVTLNNQQTHRLVLGNATFDPAKLYAQVDPPAPPLANASIQIVPVDFANAVNRPLSEWRQPPQSKPTLIQPSPSPSP